MHFSSRALNTHRSAWLCLAASLLIVSRLLPVSAAGQDASFSFGDPPTIEHSTPTGEKDVAQRLMPFPFTPPDVTLKSNENLSGANDWFTERDEKKIDELGQLDFYAPDGPASVGVVPKLHNTSAGIEIYRLDPPLNKATFEQKEGPYRPGITKKFSNKRDGKKIAKFKVGTMAESGLACFYVSRLLGHLVEVPAATYRTMDVQEFKKVAAQATTTGHPSCTAAWATLRSLVNSGSSKLLLPGGKLVFGSLAENPRGENSSPEDYWTVGAIRGHSFYRVLSSKSPVTTTLNLGDTKSLQDLALAQDMTRGVILDLIFHQVDRLGNISTDQLQHYVTKSGKIKWDDQLSDKDKADAVGAILPLKRIVYKDNDDGMMWNSSVSVAPILSETHHLDQRVYSRLQWLSGLMQDSEPGSGAKIKDYFVNAVHVSPGNYDNLKASLVKQAAALKSRVDSKDIQLDLDFEGTMRKLYAKEIAAAQGAGTGESPSPSPPASSSTATPTPIQSLSPTPTPQDNPSPTPGAGSGTAHERVVTTHSAPNGTIELATRAASFPGHPEIYSKKDIEKEKELADIDFYTGKTSDGLDIVLIPKTYSTSPGLNIHAVKLPAGMSHLAYAAAHATKNGPPGDKVIAKYKQSIPTHFTYSPSILGYYHLSRFLDCGQVEPAIVRTMDVEAHKPLADLGKAKATGSNNRQQWTELRALDDSHSNPRLYTKDGKQLFGALQANPSGEESYPHLSELSGAAAFAGSTEFGKATNPNSLKLTYKDANGKLNQPAVQQLVQVKDLADMVLLDFIMSQADRFSGNIHSKKTYMWIENDVLKKEDKKSDPAKAAEQVKKIPGDAILVNRMIMKDNDAGLISGNLAKSNHLLEKLAHMSPDTYDRLLVLQKELERPEVAQWYQDEVLFTPADFKTMKDNVDQAVANLASRKDKSLFLDASLSAALGVEAKSDQASSSDETSEPSPTPGSSPGLTSPVISSSVGRWEKGAKNLPADVETVQSMLQKAAQTLHASQVDPKGVDGKIARSPARSNTVNAIEAFESLSAIPVGGMVTPDNATWEALRRASGGP